MLIDVRSPGEFERGAFPSAVNLPVLDDDERAAVGTCYRTHGQSAAIELGERLVSGSLREARLDAAGIERAFDSEASERLFEALNPYRAEAFDTLVERLEEEAHSLRKRLLEAELEGWVRCWPGDRFTRTIR